jgi:LmbE family N-acetylglucosaminyl deacetylase
MTLLVDAANLGTPESSWTESGRAESLSPLAPVNSGRVVVVAPHPDDEVLGAGGLIQRLASSGLHIEIISVTDGEASHPGSSAPLAQRLRAVRSEELRLALSRLGLIDPSVTRLCLPDGGVSRHEQLLVDVLTARLGPGDLCVAPWAGDGHPDHEACGRAARTAAVGTGSSTLGSLIWAWHWARPEGNDVPWDWCRRIQLTRREAARKRWATSAFQSQIRPLGPAREDAAILLAPMHRRYWRPFEVFVDEDSCCG